MYLVMLLSLGLARVAGRKTGLILYVILFHIHNKPM